MIHRSGPQPGIAEERAPAAPPRPWTARPLARRAAVLAGAAIATGIGFAVYLKLSWAFPANSDGASNALQAWDMLHGNWLLSGWTLSDVSFWTTELPQYAMVELVRGLGAGVIHIAAAMTYTLAVLLAALVARGRATGRTALLGACIAAGIMLAPQPPTGLDILLSSPDHIGTSVPILLAWLLLDRWDLTRRRWLVTAGVPLLLYWAAVADDLVDYVAIAPLVLVCAYRVGRALLRRDPLAGQCAGYGESSPRPAGRVPGKVAIRAIGHEIGLAGGAIAAAVAARLTLTGVRALGGFISPMPTAQLAGPGLILHHNLPVTGHGLLLLFGADFLDYPVSPVLVLHLAGAALAASGIAFAAWRFARGRDLVSQLLLAGIVINLAVFLASTKVAWLPTLREADVVLPFAAALAGRELAPRITALPRAAAAVMVAVLGLAGLGYAGGLAREISTPVPPTPEARVAAWLSAHGLHDGLSGYWTSNVITLTSGGTVRVRLIVTGPGRARRDGVTGPPLVAGTLEDDAAWYNPRTHTANFVLLGPGTAGIPGFTDQAAVIATFGRPGRTYHTGPYTVLVWPGANLLRELAA